MKFVAQLQDQVAQQQDRLTWQQDQIVQLKEQNVQQQEYIEVFKAGIVRLKKLSPKPDIKPNSMPPNDDSGNDSEDQPSGDSEEVSPKDDNPGDDPDNEKSETGKPGSHPLATNLLCLYSIIPLQRKKRRNQGIR